jgi:hypothetical protein
MRSAVARSPLLHVAAVTAGLTSTSAFAAEWVFTPAAEVSERTQQNPHLSADKNQQNDLSTGVGAQASLMLQRRTERLSVTVQPVVRTYRFPDHSDLNRNEQHLDVSLNWQGEKVSWAGVAAAAHDTTLTSELGNTGLTQGNYRHESFDLSLGPTWMVSERLQARTSVGLYSNRYPGGESSGLENYRYSTALVGMSYVLTDRASVSLYGSAGRLDGQGSGANTDNASLTLQSRYAWSSLMSIGVGVGPSLARTDAGQQRGLLYNADVTRVFEKSALSFSLRRTQSPSGRAVLTDVEDATLAFTAQLTERLTGTASAGFTRRRDALRDLNLDLTRVHYAHADAGVSWLLAPNWRLGASVGSAVQQVGSDFYNNSTGRGFDAHLALSWNGNPHVK